MRSNVDLPQPLGPMIATSSPAAMSRSNVGDRLDRDVAAVGVTDLLERDRRATGHFGRNSFVYASSTFTGFSSSLASTRNCSNVDHVAWSCVPNGSPFAMNRVA